MIVPQTQVDPLVSRASGSADLITWSHNQYGPYFQTRSLPTDPNTLLQQAVRTAMATLTARWRDTLTSAQRRSWDVYASNVTLSSVLGRERNVGGLAQYIRSNVPRVQATEVSLPIVDTAPTLFSLPPSTPITRVVLNPTDDTIHPFFNRNDPWATDAGSALLFWASPPQPTTVNFYAGPYRYAGAILARPFPPPHNPGTLSLPWPATAADRVFIRCRLTTSDGRLSSSLRLPADIVPQLAPLPVSCRYRPDPSTFIMAFDTLLRTEAHNTLNWIPHFGDVLWRVSNIPPLSMRVTLRSKTTIHC